MKLELAFFTLPLNPQWQKTVEADPRWSKSIQAKAEFKEPWRKDPMTHILAHKKTEKALESLIRASRGELPVDFFCDVLSGCYYRAVMAYRSRNLRPSDPKWMSNRWELKRMADATREMKNRLSVSVKRLTEVNKALFIERDILGRVICHWLHSAGGRDHIKTTDKEILELLDDVAEYWDILSKPRPAHRPQQYLLDFLIMQLDLRFRQRFDKPHIPIIALLTQIASDVEGIISGTKPENWTSARVIQRLKRIHYRRITTSRTK